MASQDGPLFRERIALIYGGEQSGFDHDAITSTDGHLSVPSFEAVREDRITVQVEDLPAEVLTHIKAFSKLHLRWTSPWSYKTLEPFVSRTPPGLHLSYAPLGDADSSVEHMCYLLKAFGISQCDSLEAFQSTDSKSAKGPSTLHFSESLEDLKSLSEYLKSLCPKSNDSCQNRADSLLSASSFDLTYEVGESVKFSALWPLRPQEVSASSTPTGRTEVGIFSHGSHFEMGTYAIGLMGDLVVLGEEQKLTPTSFQVPGRHRQSGGYFSSKFLLPTGLHPSLQLHLGNNRPPLPDAECGLYTYLSLPKTIFPDRYQLDDALFLASKNLSALVQQWGTVDLEAPAYRTKPWGSNLLLKLATPPSGQEWTAEIPLHLRYLEPSEATKAEVEIPYPVVFWACETDDDDLNFKHNPFDRTNVGYDGAFSSKTAFWHLNPQPEVGSRLVNSITVPVLDAGGAKWIELVTSAVIAVGFGWVLWKLTSALSLFGYSGRKEVGVKLRKKN